MKWLLTIVTAVALLVAVPFTARVQAQSTPPYYYQAGSSSIPSNQCTASAFTLTCGGLTGQGTCLAQWTGGGAGTISGSLIIATTSPRPAIVFYSSTGANLGNTVSDTGGPYFFKCPNVTGFTITDTVTPYSYVIVATPLAWPFLASDISPAPSASPVCGGDFSPAPIPAGGAGPTPTPANCYVAFGGAIIGPHPATPGPTVHAFVVSGDANVCVTGGNAGFVNWGLSDSQIIGTPVAATIWGAGCYNMNNNPGGGSSFLGAALDGAGDLAVNGSLYPGAGGSIFVQNGNAVNFTPASSTVAGCNLGNLGGTGPGPGVELVHATTGTCTFVLPDLATGALLCTNANSQVTTTGCPTPSPAPAPSISGNPPIVASYNGVTNTYNVSCSSCNTSSTFAQFLPIQSANTYLNSPGTGQPILTWGSAPAAGDQLFWITSVHGNPSVPTGWATPGVYPTPNATPTILLYTRTATGGANDTPNTGTTPGSTWRGVAFEMPSTCTASHFSAPGNVAASGAVLQIPPITTTGPAFLVGLAWESGGNVDFVAPPWTTWFLNTNAFTTEAMPMTMTALAATTTSATINFGAAGTTAGADFEITC